MRANSRGFCQKQVTFTRKQKILEGSGFQKKLKDFIRRDLIGMKEIRKGNYRRKKH